MAPEALPLPMRCIALFAQPRHLCFRTAIRSVFTCGDRSLDNGEPDERSLHEGAPPTRGVKYAINGWVRSKKLFPGRPRTV